VPDEFAFMCYYKVKWFSHDFGMYSEIVLIYNDACVYKWEENNPEKIDRFWNWFNDVEAGELLDITLLVLRNRNNSKFPIFNGK